MLKLNHVGLMLISDSYEVCSPGLQCVVDGEGHLLLDIDRGWGLHGAPFWTVYSGQWTPPGISSSSLHFWIKRFFLLSPSYATYNFGSSIFSSIETNSAKGACKTIEKCELMLRRHAVHPCSAEELYSRGEGRVGHWGGGSGNSNMQDGGPLRCSHTAHSHTKETHRERLLVAEAEGEHECWVSWEETLEPVDKKYFFRSSAYTKSDERKRMVILSDWGRMYFKHQTWGILDGRA